jgi:hypothetical protein
MINFLQRMNREIASDFGSVSAKNAPVWTQSNPNGPDRPDQPGLAGTSPFAACGFANQMSPERTPDADLCRKTARSADPA